MLNFGKFKPNIVVVGLGGLGSATVKSLVQTGFSKILLVDHDKVELSNLQRQCLYSEDDIGTYKAKAAEKVLQQMSPKTNVRPLIKKIDKTNLKLLKSNLVLDCTDNLETRFLINSYCVKEGIPWVYCSVAGDHGFAKAITKDTACLECFYKRPEKPETPKTIGILNTAVFFAASIQSSLASKILTKKPVDNVLFSFNVMTPEIKRITIMKNPNCKVCR